jgi:tRNA(fMet)-specific endonuclease VapC
VKYVLDTNIVTRLLSGDERVLAHLVNVDPSDIGIPLLGLAELLFGAEKSARRDENRERIRRLTKSLRMLPLELAVSRRYAVVRADVERRERLTGPLVAEPAHAGGKPAGGTQLLATNASTGQTGATCEEPENLTFVEKTGVPGRN